jgi:hypothetical protein
VRRSFGVAPRSGRPSPECDRSLAAPAAEGFRLRTGEQFSFLRQLFEPISAASAAAHCELVPSAAKRGNPCNSHCTFAPMGRKAWVGPSGVLITLKS